MIEMFMGKDVLGGISWLLRMVLTPCEWGLSLYEWVCGVVRGFPFAIIITGRPSAIVIVVYYFILFGGIYYLKKHYYGKSGTEEKIIKKRVAKRKKAGVTKRGCVLAGIGALVCLLLIIYPKSGPQEIVFLDVGQGDGIYISTGEGTRFFIDGGSAFSDSIGEYTILPFLKSKGVRKIDYWFVSHADKDHVSGLIEVLESDYVVEHLVVSKFAVEDENMVEILGLATEKGVDVIYMKAFDRVQTDGVMISCIYPGAEDVKELYALATDRNEGSMVLEVCFEEFGDFSDFRAFFSGDISSKVEEWLVAKARVSEVYLYKAAHHGSRYSNSAALLEALSPKMAVISCSENNTYGHPSADAVSRIENAGAIIYYTMKEGQITIRADGVYPLPPR